MELVDLAMRTAGKQSEVHFGGAAIFKLRLFQNEKNLEFHRELFATVEMCLQLENSMETKSKAVFSTSTPTDSEFVTGGTVEIQQTAAAYVMRFLSTVLLMKLYQCVTCDYFIHGLLLYEQKKKSRRWSIPGPMFWRFEEFCVWCFFAVDNLMFCTLMVCFNNNLVVPISSLFQAF